MILVETTHWPLVVVGAVPGSPWGADDASSPPDEEWIWSGGDLRLAIVISGAPAQAWMAHGEVFRWLTCHRERLWRCVYRAAWIFDDEPMRRSAERWLTLAGDRLFQGEVTTFRSVQPALCWLVTDRDDQKNPMPEPVPAWARRATY